MKSLDDLLRSTEPHGTFHDAELIELHIDYVDRSLVARFDLCVGNPESTTKAERERRRQGRLKLNGLLFWAIDPPAPRALSHSSRRPWLTSDGPLEEAPNASAKDLAAALPGDGVAWYLYFSDLDAFAYCAARTAEFQWI